MQRIRSIGFVALSGLAWGMAGSAPAFAQPNVSRSALAIAAAVGVAGAGNSWSGGGRGPVFSGYVEVPIVPTWRLRVSGGRMRWTPTNEPHDDGPRAGSVCLTYAGVAVTRSGITPSLRFPVGVYGGVGIGYYSYRIRRGPFSNPGSAGLHALGGIEVPSGSIATSACVSNSRFTPPEGPDTRRCGRTRCQPCRPLWQSAGGSEDRRSRTACWSARVELSTR